MSDVEPAGREQPEHEPTLSELLAEEVRSGKDAGEGFDASAGYVEPDELPRKICELLAATTFAEAVREEVDWVIAYEALLPVATRSILLAAVDRALRVNAAEVSVRQTPEAPFADVPEESREAAAELRDILDRVASRQVNASGFVPARVVELAQRAGIDPVRAFAVCRRSIRSAQGRGSSLRQSAGILGSHADDEWENLLQEVRRLLFVIGR
jgi:hypothetical protein